MSDRSFYIAFVLNKGEWGQQLLRHVFEHPIVEYWGEPEEQANLKAYFKANHYSHKEPIQIEPAEMMSFLPYKEQPHD